jgi:hypothetical protein
VEPQLLFTATLVFFSALLGRGGGGSKSQADLSLTATPLAIKALPGGRIAGNKVIATAVNGFGGRIAVTVGPLPTDVTAAPSSLSLLPSGQGQIGKGYRAHSGRRSCRSAPP